MENPNIEIPSLRNPMRHYLNLEPNIFQISQYIPNITFQIAFDKKIQCGSRMLTDEFEILDEYSNDKVGSCAIYAKIMVYPPKKVEVENVNFLTEISEGRTI